MFNVIIHYFSGCSNDIYFRRPQNESDIKHPRARLLLEKWRTVWLLAMERQRRLQDRRNYLLEVRLF